MLLIYESYVSWWYNNSHIVAFLIPVFSSHVSFRSLERLVKNISHENIFLVETLT
jgi:hypothetical protein